jgi:hypothetical protein
MEHSTELWGCPVDYGDYAPFGIDAISDRRKKFVSAQAVTLKHWNAHWLLPPGGSARIKKAAQWEQVGRSGCPTTTPAPAGRTVGKVDFRPDRKLHL